MLLKYPKWSFSYCSPASIITLNDKNPLLFKSNYSSRCSFIPCSTIKIILPTRRLWITTKNVIHSSKVSWNCKNRRVDFIYLSWVIPDSFIINLMTCFGNANSIVEETEFLLLLEKYFLCLDFSFSSPPIFIMTSFALGKNHRKFFVA